MERIVYEQYLEPKKSLVANEKKWYIRLDDKYDKILGSKIIDIRFQKEENDLNDDSIVEESCNLLIELSNGHSIELYYNIENKLCMESD